MDTESSLQQLVLLNPDDPGYPLDVWKVEIAVRRAPVILEDDYEKYLRDLLASPGLEKVRENLAAIALQHGLADDEFGRLTALHSVLLAMEELGSRRRAAADRVRACEAAGDEAGHIQALYEQALLQPDFVDHWRDLAAFVEKKKSAAAALEYLRAGEPYQQYQRNDNLFWLERLRLICACGTREEALAEGRRYREKFGLFELFIQADEDYLRAWRTDPDAQKLREMFDERGE